MAESSLNLINCELGSKNVTCYLIIGQFMGKGSSITRIKYHWGVNLARAFYFRKFRLAVGTLNSRLSVDKECVLVQK